MAFDSYHKWLGIPAPEQPPHHYRLLGIELFEDDPDVIESAADQRMAILRTRQSGEHAPQAQRLLNDVAAARLCLLNPEKKAAYDADLRQRLAPPPAVLETVAQAPDPPEVPFVVPLQRSPVVARSGKQRTLMNDLVRAGLALVAFTVAMASVIGYFKYGVSVRESDRTAAKPKESTRQRERISPRAPRQKSDQTVADRGDPVQAIGAGPGRAASANTTDSKSRQPNSSARFAVEIPDKDRGKWLIEGDELVQSSLDRNADILFGDPEWQDFDFSVEAKRTAGRGGPGLWFRCQTDRDTERFVAGHFGRAHSVLSADNGEATTLATVDGTLPENMWHRVEVRVRGQTGRCYVNGAEVLLFTSPRQGRGRLGLGTWGTTYRFRNILVKSPEGRVLLEGLPDLDGRSTNRIAPATAAASNPVVGVAALSRDTPQFPYDARPEGRDWSIQGNELVHQPGFVESTILFGDPSWTDYDLCFDAKMQKVGHARLLFRHQDDRNFHGYLIGGWNNTWEIVESVEGGNWGKRQCELNRAIPSDAWQPIRISVRGDKGTCFRNGGKVGDFSMPRLARGRVGLTVQQSAAYSFRNIVVKSPEGKVLLEGLPGIRKRTTAYDPFDLMQRRPMAVKSSEARWEQDYIYLHSPGYLSFEIPKGVKGFTAEGTLRVPGDVRFTVFVDGAIAFRSDPITEGKRVKIDVPLKPGAKLLTLFTDPNGQEYWDHGLWLRPHFVARGNARVDPSSQNQFDALHATPIFAQTREGVEWASEHIDVKVAGRLRFEIPDGAKRFVTDILVPKANGNAKFVVTVDGAIAQQRAIDAGAGGRIDVPLPPGSRVLEIYSEPSGGKGPVNSQWSRPRFLP